jgi:hypothetical protein
MYKFPNLPVVPELKSFKESWDECNQRWKYYFLDWKPKEKHVKKKYDDRVGRGLEPPNNFRKTEIFPDEYIEWLYGLRFRISDSYLREIAYQTKCGQEEWSRMFPTNFPHSLDTMVREYCLGSAIAHFETAFFLLSDCLFSPKEGEEDVLDKEKYGGLEHFAKVVMLMYFWDGQTGSGLIQSNAGFDSIVPNVRKRTRDAKKIGFVGDFCVATNNKIGDRFLGVSID